MKRICDILNRLPIALGMFLLLCIVTLTSINVVARYIFNYGLVWSDELVRYSLLWITFIGSAVLVRYKQHLAIDIFEKTMPHRVRAVAYYFTHVIILCVAVIFIWQGTGQALRQASQVSPGTGIPVGIVYIIIPISGVYMVCYATYNMVDYFRNNILK